MAIKAELKTEQDKITKIQAFDPSCYWHKSHFEDDGTQNYFVFQPAYRYSKKKFGNTDHILVCNSKGLSDESIKSPATSDKNFLPSLNYIGTKKRAKFNVSFLKQDKIIFVDAL